MFFFNSLTYWTLVNFRFFFKKNWTFEMFMHFLFDILNFWKLIIGISFFEDVAQHGCLACTCKKNIYIYIYNIYIHEEHIYISIETYMSDMCGHISRYVDSEIHAGVNMWIGSLCFCSMLPITTNSCNRCGCALATKFEVCSGSCRLMHLYVN